MKYRMLMTSACLTAMLMASASAPAYSSLSGGKGDTDMDNRIISNKIAKPKQRKETPAINNTNEKLYKVTCRFELQEGEFSPSYSIYNAQLCQNDYDWEDDDTLPEPAEEDTAEFMIPEGIYDIYAYCWITASADEAGLVNIIREGVEVNSDMIITFHTDEATENIVFENILPNGEPMKLIWLDKEGKPDISHADEIPNVEYWYGIYYIWNKDVGEVTSNISATDYYIADIVEPGKYKLRINKLSDNYKVFQSSIINDSNGNLYLTRVEAKNVCSGKYSNDPSDYLTYDEDYRHTPLFDDNGPGKYKYRVGFRDIVDGYQLSGVIGDFDYDELNVNVCAPQVKLSEEKNLDMMIYHGVFEGGKTMEGLPIRNVGGKWEHVNNNHCGAKGNFLFQIPADGSKVCELPPHPAFSYMHDEKKMAYGNSSPICSTSIPHEIYENGVHIDFLTPTYIGRYGEVRNQDLLKTNVEVYVNGNNVYSGAFNGLEDWQIERGESNPTASKIRMSLHNNNVQVDDIKGFTVTEISWDENLEDHTPPTTQMLMFKSEDGTITDRFTHASQGIIELAAADFNFTGEWYEHAPVRLTVMCQPNNVDDAEMIPIEMEELPELFMMPNFGYFYRGSLKNVNASSPNGWYDLIIILEDLAGNTQMQYISPAFNINESVAIQSVESEDMRIVKCGDYLTVDGTDNPYIDIYTIDGKHILSSNDKAIYCGNLGSGVYIVSVSHSSGTKNFKVVF